MRAPIWIDGKFDGAVIACRNEVDAKPLENDGLLRSSEFIPQTRISTVFPTKRASVASKKRLSAIKF